MNDDLPPKTHNRPKYTGKAKASNRTKFYPADQFIRIPTPRPSVIPRGRYSQKSEDPMRSIRISDEMWGYVDQACKLLGCTKAEFIRWVAYSSASEIIRLAEEAGTELGHLPNNLLFPENMRPRFDKVLVIEKGGGKMSMARVDYAKEKPFTTETIQAKPLDSIKSTQPGNKKIVL